MHLNREVVDFVETRICKLCVLLRSRVLRGVYVTMKDIGRLLGSSCYEGKQGDFTNAV